MIGHVDLSEKDEKIANQKVIIIEIWKDCDVYLTVQ